MEPDPDQAGWKHDGPPHMGAEHPQLGMEQVGPEHAEVIIGGETKIGPEQLGPLHDAIGAEHPNDGPQQLGPEQLGPAQLERKIRRCRKPAVAS